MVSTTSGRSYSFRQYLNARSAYSPQFSTDGAQIAFLADITGVPQVWQVPVEGGWPQQLTFTDDRVMTVHYAHHSSFIVFGMDAGGNEREQFFTLQEGMVDDLAVDEAVMHMWGAVSPDDLQVAFSDNRRHPAHFDVYIRSLEDGSERLVYQQDGSNIVQDWSPDGRFLLIGRRTGSLDGELILFDLETGQDRHLTPHEPPVSYEAARFAPDSSAIYLITDAGSEFGRLARMDPANGQIEYLTPDDVDTEAAELSPDGTHLALVRNVDGYSRLSILNVGSGEETSVSGLPNGVLMQPAWSPDGRRLAFAFTSPSSPFNIWLWDGNTCRQITQVATGGIPEDMFVAPELVHFSTFDGLDIPAFLYMPAGVERPPVLMNVHGGPESQSRPAFAAVTQYFVNHGFAVLVPNVRGSTGYGRTYTHLDDVEKRMDSVADLEAAVRWLREGDRVDGERIAIMGGSYGGFMVLAALTTYPDLWAAGVDIVGIANFETFFQNTGAYRRHWRTAEYGDPERDRDLLRRISPIHYVDRIRAPLMVIHGDNDPRVPVGETEQIVEAISRQGIPVELLRFPDEGHGVVKLKNKLVAYPAVAEFLDRYLTRAGSS